MQSTSTFRRIPSEYDKGAWKGGCRYEERRFPATEVSPGELREHLIEVRGVTNIISGARGISAANRGKLAEFFHVSPKLFVVGA